MTHGVILPATHIPATEQFLADTGGTGVPRGWSMSGWAKREAQQPGGDQGEASKEEDGISTLFSLGPLVSWEKNLPVQGPAHPGS